MSYFSSALPPLSPAPSKQLGHSFLHTPPVRSSYQGLTGRASDLSGENDSDDESSMADFSPAPRRLSGLFAQAMNSSQAAAAGSPMTRSRSLTPNESPASTPLQAMKLQGSPATRASPQTQFLALPQPSPDRNAKKGSPKRQLTESVDKKLNAGESPAKKQTLGIGKAASMAPYSDECKEPEVAESFMLGQSPAGRHIGNDLGGPFMPSPPRNTRSRGQLSLASSPSIAKAQQAFNPLLNSGAASSRESLVEDEPMTSPSISIPIPSNLLLVSGLLSELSRLALPENFDVDESEQVLKTLDELVFSSRKDEKIKELLYKPSFFLRICEIKNRILNHEAEPVAVRHHERSVTRLVNSSLAQATMDQKKALISTLGRNAIACDPTYTFLGELIFAKYYRSIDQEHTITKPPSDRQTIHQAIQQCQAALDGSAKDELLGKVIAFAQSELKKISAKTTHEIDRFCHFTVDSSVLVSILQTGIQVSHQSKFKGAFVSTLPEGTFGKFGVTVSSKELLGKMGDQIQRRDEEDNGAIWIGAQETLPVLQDKILYSSAVTQAELNKLKAELEAADISNYELVPAEVYSTYLEYSRKNGWAVPIPLNLSPGRLKVKKRGEEK